MSDEFEAIVWVNGIPFGKGIVLMSFLPAPRTKTDDLMDEAVRLVRQARNQKLIADEKKKRK